MTYYTVEGLWPFPLDMLRHDGSYPATADDQEKIERLSRACTIDGFGLSAKVRIQLRKGWSGLPNDERWQSFGWKVVEHPAMPRIELDRRMRDKVRREDELRKSGLAKLTPEEREALGLED